jgi:hypothetical protein
MALTGCADGPPRLAPGPLALCARGALAALSTLARGPDALELDAAALLGERAAIAGLARAGRTAPGRHCRLLAARDGWLALNLARTDDEAMLSAWLECDRGGGDEAIWDFACRGVAARGRDALVDRGRLMGLPVAPAAEPPSESVAWHRCDAGGVRRSGRAPDRPRVLDLSSLWAGPLCTSLLERAGADVIKVESLHRPDGARRGPAAFFDLINAGKRSVAVDLRAGEGVRLLRSLIDHADIVVESARPRALGQLGIDAEACVAARPGLTWLAITGYGRRGPEAGWVAFGDDAAVAAGAAARTGSAGERPLFCGDAIADPLTGLHAAVAALAAHQSGGGVVLDVALCSVTAHALAWPPAAIDAEPSIRRADEGHGGATGYVLQVGERTEPVASPRARSVQARAAALGADTGAVLDELRVA